MSAVSTPRIVEVPVSGYAILVGEGTLRTAGLGSCVAVMLHDPVTRIGALAHVLLPLASMSRDRSRPAKFGEQAAGFLADEMRRQGAGRDLVARMVGGASMFGPLLTSGINMGERNVQAVRASLGRLGIPLLGEDVGGESGRSVAFDVATGIVRVTSMHQGDRDL